MYRVILADDERWVTYGLTRLISWEEYGFTIVETARDGLEAIRKVREYKPDLLLTDIRMPGITGLELLERLRKEDSKTLVIFMSGYSDFSYARQALRLGAFDYLVKEVEAEELTIALERAKEYLVVQAMENKEQIAEGLLAEQTKITQIMNYIEANCTREIKLRDLAEKFFMTENYLSFYIRQQTGQTFTDLLAEKRIEIARRLLTQTQLSIQEIAERVGYSEYYYFSKLFKKRVGCTMTEYRKQAEQKT